MSVQTERPHESTTDEASYQTYLSADPFPGSLAILESSSQDTSSSLHPGRIHVTPPSMSESGVPVWQPDDEIEHCALCLKNFTFFLRKHHCRMCGRIVCASCSSNFTTYLPNTYVVSPPSQIFLESPHVPHRTCDECADELDMIRSALREGSASTISHNNRDESIYQQDDSIKMSPEQVTTVEMSHSSSRLTLTEDTSKKTKHNHSRRNRHHFMDDDDLCPVCMKFVGALSEAEREAHINDCLTAQEFSGSPETKRQKNRMLVYTIPNDADIS
ncbi:DEKNAAC105503, partial [Brettanomyces naardenensis]